MNVAYALLGEELEIAERVHLTLEDGKVQHVGKGWVTGGETYPTGLILPALVNAHVHTFDSAFPEFGMGLTLKEAVGDPQSEKYKLIGSLTQDRLKESTLDFLRRSRKIGVMKVVDFKELDLLGAKVAKEVKLISPIEYVALGRLDGDFSRERLETLRDMVDGYGLSSVTSVTRETMKEIREVFKDKLVVAHVSETLRQNLSRDLETILSDLRPDLVVHGTRLAESELSLLRDEGVGLVLCPRSNLWWGTGVPNVPLIFREEVHTLLGTDNAAWNDHDLWKEMETALLISRLLEPGSDYSREVLKAGTVHGGTNPILEGHELTGVIVEAEWTGITRAINKYAAIVKRGGQVINVINERVQGGRKNSPP